MPRAVLLVIVDERLRGLVAVFLLDLEYLLVVHLFGKQAVGLSRVLHFIVLCLRDVVPLLPRLVHAGEGVAFLAVDVGNGLLVFLSGGRLAFCRPFLHDLQAELLGGLLGADAGVEEFGGVVVLFLRVF